jgi:competence protein ComEC
MASSAAAAPSTHLGPLQIGLARRVRWLRDAIERWLEAERDQLPLWLPVALAAGIALWFALPDPRAWQAAMLALGGVALAALALARNGRAGRALAIGATVCALGIALIWWRAEHVAQPVLARPAITTFAARVAAIDPLAARELVRLTLHPIADASADAEAPPLPPTLRVNLQQADMPGGLTVGATIRLGARLMPPPPPDVPGAYDFARVAWFGALGATGRGYAPVTIVTPGRGGEGGLRAALSRHIQARLPGSAGGIADALATGDRGAISQADSDAMRRAGLAHLLAVSGLHVSAVIGGVMLVTLSLLALWPWLALRVRLPLVAAGAGAVAAIGYTLLTGSQVPTIRSCVAALLILAAMMIGREAVTLRLVATGAVIVLLVAPEALVGPSFQLSFAAVTAIIALHEQPQVRGWFGRHEEGWARRLLRGAASLLFTGAVVELALFPIALFHFHKAGLYGALANIVAIPLTTFAVMPLEALALLFDLAGLGAPFWWLAGRALAALLWIAHTTAAAPGSLAMLPAMPGGAYALIITGGLWISLWRTRWRRLGVMPLLIGAIWALATPPPDLLVTGDGRHLAVRMGDGKLALLRDRTGEYTQDMMAENAGFDGIPYALSDQPEAQCSADLCRVTRHIGGRDWHILATRSAYPVDFAELTAACRAADIVISDRRLPKACAPRWLKLDAPVLAKTGGITIALAGPHVTTVNDPADRHPWRGVAGNGGTDPATSRSGLSDSHRRRFPNRRHGSHSDRHRTSATFDN